MARRPEFYFDEKTGYYRKRIKLADGRYKDVRGVRLPPAFSLPHGERKIKPFSSAHENNCFKVVTVLLCIELDIPAISARRRL